MAFSAGTAFALSISMQHAYPWKNTRNSFFRHTALLWILASCLAFTAQAQTALQQVSSGRCVDDLGWGTQEGEPLGLWDCDGDQNQNYTLTEDSQGYYSIINSYSGMCLDVTGWTTIVGAKLQQWDCNGDDNQKFKLNQKATGEFQLVSKFDSLCVDFAGGSSADGTLLVQNTCSSSTAQEFKIAGIAAPAPSPSPTPTPTPTPTQTSSSNFVPVFASTIKNVASSSCIDDLGYSTTSGTAPGIWSCDGGSNQTFSFTENSAGTYSLQNDYSKFCLSAGSAGSTVVQQACASTAAQSFQLHQLSAGVFELQSAGLCLDLIGGNATNGTELQMGACSGSVSQQFAISAPVAQNISLTVPPSSATVVGSIESLNDWSDCNGACSACPAGDPNCHGSISNMVPEIQHVNGTGMFQVNAGPAYATSLWGHSIGSSVGYTHFLWDFQFMVNTATVENQEFDLYTVVNGRQYMFGSQCNHDNGNWQGWNNSTQTWLNSSVPCAPVTPSQWHHVVMDLQINPSTGTYTYNAIQIDGYTYPANLSNEPSTTSNWGSVVGVQIQLDQDASGSPVQESIRDMSVTMW